MPDDRTTHAEAIMPKSIEEWIKEGEELYSAALNEYHALEHQLEQIEQHIAHKQAEVNRIASVIGKAPIEQNRRLTAQLVSDHGPNSVPNSPATIARALSGRGLNR